MRADELAAAFNSAQAASMRIKALAKQQTIQAKTAWVWTPLAEEQMKTREIRAGQLVWPEYQPAIPAFYVERGLVTESG